MKLKNKKKKCLRCGRIITDSKNKTGLCPKCQKKANGIVLGAGVGAGAIGIKYGIKKYGPKIVKSIVNVVKK